MHRPKATKLVEDLVMGTRTTQKQSDISRNGSLYRYPIYSKGITNEELVTCCGFLLVGMVAFV